MVAFWRAAVAAHTLLFGAGDTAPDCDAALGMNVFDFEGAVPRLAVCVAALARGGTPGADNTATGRVTVAALGAIDLPGAALVVEALFVVSAVVEAAFAAVSGVSGAIAGCVVDETVAVIE
jgi:hypothetical protein